MGASMTEKEALFSIRSLAWDTFLAALSGATVYATHAAWNHVLLDGARDPGALIPPLLLTALSALLTWNTLFSCVAYLSALPVFPAALQRLLVACVAHCGTSRSRTILRRRMLHVSATATMISALATPAVMATPSLPTPNVAQPSTCATACDDAAQSCAPAPESSDTPHAPRAADGQATLMHQPAAHTSLTPEAAAPPGAHTMVPLVEPPHTPSQLLPTPALPTAGLPTAGLPTPALPTSTLPTATLPTPALPTPALPTAGLSTPGAANPQPDDPGLADPGLADMGLRVPGESGDPAKLATAASSPNADTYTVKAGDSLWTISARLIDSEDPALIAHATADLYAANEDVIGSNPDIIHPGMVLSLPETLKVRS